MSVPPTTVCDNSNLLPLFQCRNLVEYAMYTPFVSHLKVLHLICSNKPLTVRDNCFKPMLSQTPIGMGLCKDNFIILFMKLLYGIYYIIFWINNNAAPSYESAALV